MHRLALSVPCDQFPDSPDVICNPGFHGRRDAQCRVNPAEVVVGEPKRIGSLQVLPLLRESIGQTGHAAHSHPDAEVLALNVAGAYPVADRPSHDLDWD